MSLNKLKRFVNYFFNDLKNSQESTLNSTLNLNYEFKFTIHDRKDIFIYDCFKIVNHD